AQAGILTDDIHSNANIQLIEGVRIERSIKEGKVVILAGFQGVGTEGDITTLGRGGSDTTALAVAAQLKADRCEILKDFPAIYSADPELVKDAFPLTQLSYDQLLEMTFWGANCLQYRSVEIAKNFKVPLYVGSAHTKENGTKVEDMKMIEDSEVIALNSHKNVLRIHTPLASLSEAILWLRKFLETKNIPFPQLLHSEMFSTGIDLFMTAPVENIGAIANEMRYQACEPEGLCSVTTTCRGSTSSELVEKIVDVLEKKEIQIMYMIISAMSVTIFIKPGYRIQAIELLHQMIKVPSFSSLTLLNSP
ncbi:MAG: amino acid kinase family protein, partial [Bacteriovorax sp.]